MYTGHGSHEVTQLLQRHKVTCSGLLNQFKIPVDSLSDRYDHRWLHRSMQSHFSWFQFGAWNLILAYTGRAQRWRCDRELILVRELSTLICCEPDDE